MRPKNLTDQLRAAGAFEDPADRRVPYEQRMRRSLPPACRAGECDHKYQYEHCPNHGSEMWCQDCIAQPTAVEVTLPDGTKSRGMVMGNLGVSGLKEIMGDAVRVLEPGER